MTTECGALALVNIHGKLEFLRTVAFLEIVFPFMGVNLPFFYYSRPQKQVSKGIFGNPAFTDLNL